MKKNPKLELLSEKEDMMLLMDFRQERWHDWERFCKKNGHFPYIKEERNCNHCGKPMTEGYCINGGEEYYCQDFCLDQAKTKKQIKELDIGADDSESYWTQWD